MANSNNNNNNINILNLAFYDISFHILFHLFILIEKMSDIYIESNYRISRIKFELMDSWKVFVKERPLNIHICWIHERVGAICRYGLNLEGKNTKLYLQLVHWGCYNTIPWTFVSHSSGLFEILKIRCLRKALVLVHRWPYCCVFHW